MSFKTSQNGINLIKSFEGCRLTAYQDSAGVWTIGYGHTAKVYSSMKITEEQAIKFLKSDIKNAENAVNSRVTYIINQNQFDALVSFTYNVGVGNFSSSTLLKKLNQSDILGAANEFDKWVNAGGKVLKGLVRRRASEKDIFLDGVARDSTICAFQTWLNNNFLSRLMVDGFYGVNTKKAATMAYQRILGVSEDGIFGAESKASVVTLQAGSTGDEIHIMQGMLYCLKFNPNGVDGIFGPSTTAAVKNFQSSKRFIADGCASSDTMYALFNL